MSRVRIPSAAHKSKLQNLTLYGPLWHSGLVERILRTKDGGVDTVKEVDLIAQEILSGGGSARMIRVAEAVADEALEAVKRKIKEDLKTQNNK